jgi:hypothetical protein
MTIRDEGMDKFQDWLQKNNHKEFFVLSSLGQIGYFLKYLIEEKEKIVNLEDKNFEWDFKHNNVFKFREELIKEVRKR